MILIFFSDEWGNQFGGINTFNYSLCTNLRTYIAEEAKTTGLIVATCGVTETIKDEFSNVANVSMLNFSLNDFNDASKVAKILKKTINTFQLGTEDRNEIFCCGHDIITGEVAENCASELNAKSVVFHHMAYKEYYGELAKDETSLLEKINKQSTIITNADIVLGIGPKLENSAKSIVNLADANTIVKCMIPGFDGIKTGTINRNQFTIFFSGRIEPNNDVIKQYGLVVKAFCELLEENRISHNSQLILCGIAGEEAEKKIAEIKNSITQKVAYILTFSYLDHEKAINFLRGANVAVMPSFDEGFGLTGLEAIGAAVPLILSKNSGLYQFLNAQSLSNHIKSVDISGDDNPSLEQIKRRLLEIKDDENSCRRSAAELKDALDEFSWKNIVERLLKFLSYSKYDKTTEEKFFEILKNCILFDKGIV
ncbi:MAG: glycosyltransferase family 4 protein [Clostridia bacterium]|nr:glycosyltransferase family 4 protein [Clostridia bacterium]